MKKSSDFFQSLSNVPQGPDFGFYVLCWLWSPSLSSSAALREVLLLCICQMLRRHLRALDIKLGWCWGTQASAQASAPGVRPLIGPSCILEVLIFTFQEIACMDEHRKPCTFIQQKTLCSEVSLRPLTHVFFLTRLSQDSLNLLPN